VPRLPFAPFHAPFGAAAFTVAFIAAASAAAFAADRGDSSALVGAIVGPRREARRCRDHDERHEGRRRCRHPRPREAQEAADIAMVAAATTAAASDSAAAALMRSLNRPGPGLGRSKEVDDLGGLTADGGGLDQEGQERVPRQVLPASPNPNG
jgi:hypothetical protein